MNSPTERGRVIPIRLHEELHRGSAEAIQRIQEKYADNPNVRTSYVVNSSERPPRAGSIEDIRKTRYSGLGEQLGDILDNERAARRISQSVYDRVHQGPGFGAVVRQDNPGDDEGSGQGPSGIPGSACPAVPLWDLSVARTFDPRGGCAPNSQGCHVRSGHPIHCFERPFLQHANVEKEPYL